MFISTHIFVVQIYGRERFVIVPWLPVPVLKLLDRSFWLQRWRLLHIKKRRLECFYLSVPSPHILQHVLNRPVCSMLIASY